MFPFTLCSFLHTPNIHTCKLRNILGVDGFSGRLFTLSFVRLAMVKVHLIVAMMIEETGLRKNHKHS